VILDATGVGDPIYDDLKRVLPEVEPFVMTAGAKVELVQRLAVSIEKREISWPVGSRQLAVGGTSRQLAVGSEQSSGDALGTSRSTLPTANCSLLTDPWETLTAELKRYEYGIGPTGRISYGAPSGYHDDCVMALALANHGRWNRGYAGSCFPVCVGDSRFGFRPQRGWYNRGRERAIDGI